MNKQPRAAAAPEIELRDRITGLERVAGRDLLDNTGNWRMHPSGQRRALSGLLSQVGIADAVIAYRSPREGGALTLIDGHLRRSLSPDIVWPVLVLDVSDEEADLLLASIDPLAAMAQSDQEALGALLDGLHIEDATLGALLTSIVEGEQQAAFVPPAPDPLPEPPEPIVTPTKRRAVRNLPEPPVSWGVIVECADEDEQTELLERMVAEGLSCRALMS